MFSHIGVLMLGLLVFPMYCNTKTPCKRKETCQNPEEPYTDDAYTFSFSTYFPDDPNITYCPVNPTINYSYCCPKQNRYDCTVETFECLIYFRLNDNVCKILEPEKVMYRKCSCGNCVPYCPQGEWCKLQPGRCMPACGRSTTVNALCLDARSNPVKQTLTLCLPTQCHCVPRA
ncbi:uncharacterized protein LOC131929644 isoform X3 [Physella acuta]|uniref:uncharacterized protein LOC131929644 isoform X3 n=1 Tax=Physella acuta TaxID=109671 RepID=UPI0027DC494A|nr:uncharacterized protein LOC131929644 isoform X3 [Physella acuta]